MKKYSVVSLIALLFCLCAAGFVSTHTAQEDKSTQPTQLRLSWSDDPRTTMTVTWQTAAPTTTSAVEFGTTEQLGQRVAAKRVTYPYETGVLHEATLRGLKPNTRYFYRVITTSSNGLAETHRPYSFRTAPRRAQEFTFVALGDHGTSDVSRKNVERMAKENPAFGLVLGDISYANGKQPVWDEWFQLVEPFTRAFPLMTALGNHENEGKRLNDEANRYSAYLSRFAMPAPETWYHFDYAGVRFVSFNSDDYQNAEQLQWFEKTLKEARQDVGNGRRAVPNGRRAAPRWLIVFQHHPLYSSNVRRLNNTGLINTVRKLLDDYKVDLVLAGHNHNYERTYPLRDINPTTSEKSKYRHGEGVIFVTSGGGGKSLYDFVPEQPPFTAYREKVSHYLRVKASASALSVEAVRTEDGTVMERFEMRE
jgi:predicted MPP superfamily phosphohydrolase